MNLQLPKNIQNPFHYGQRLKPARDWLVILFIGFVLLVASIGWNVWLFFRVTSGEAIGNATVPATLNPASIDSVNTLFQQRATTETQYKNGHFVDPSQLGS